MTLADTARRHPAHARVRRSWARTALVVLAAGALGGCAGITNPYQSTGTTRTPTAASTSTTTAPADSGDPAPERGGTIPSSARAAQTKLAIGAASRSPEAALERYAELYVNWTAANVAARRRVSLPRSRSGRPAQALQAAASAAHDTQLLHRVADGDGRGDHRGRDRPPATRCASPASRPPGRADSPGYRRPCTSSTPSSPTRRTDGS